MSTAVARALEDELEQLRLDPGRPVETEVG